MKASTPLVVFLSAALFTTMSNNPDLFAAQPPELAANYFVYIGTYGKGVHGFRAASASASLEPIGLVGDVTNPSWVGAGPDFEHLYAVSELLGKEEGGVASFSIDRKSGQLRSLNQLKSGGVAPCYLSVDATRKMLIVANYVTGGVSSFPIEQNGSLGAMASLMSAHGSSVNKKRQEGPHAHEAVISADNKRVYVPDLGLDQIRIYQIDPATAKLTPNDPPVVKGEPGLGPRHIVFDRSSKYAYLINELQPFVCVYEVEAATGNLKFVEHVSTVAPGETKDNSGAEIRLDRSGNFLYTSSRGYNTIQVFAVDSSSGKLEKIQDVPTGGDGPRGFNLDPSGHFLLVGNQQSNNLVVFQVDPATGKLTPTGQKYEVPSPVDVLFVPAT